MNISQTPISGDEPIDDIVTLQEILWDIKTNLIDLIQNHLKRLIHPDFRDLAEDFENTINFIKRSIGRALQELRTEIISELGQHGLTGNELQRKRRLFNRAKELYLKHVKGPIVKATEVANTFLDVADVILDSLVMVIASAGAAKEVKGTVKAVIALITHKS